MRDVTGHKRKPKGAAAVRKAREDRAVFDHKPVQPVKRRGKFGYGQMLEHIERHHRIEEGIGRKIDIIQRSQMDVVSGGKCRRMQCRIDLDPDDGIAMRRGPAQEMGMSVAQFENPRAGPDRGSRHFNSEFFVQPFGVYIGQARAPRIDIANFHIIGHITPT